MPNSKVTEVISNFIVDTSFDSFSNEVLDISKRSFLDWIAVTLGAIKEPAARILIDFVEEMGGQKQATILGHGIRTTALNATFVNGATSHILDYDDANAETRNHTSVPIVPVLLALGESRVLGGRDLLTAYVVGAEISTRIGLALGRSYYEKGWHATSILGRFGAAAGASRLLGLSHRQVLNALGLAATQCGGMRSVFGTMAKPFHVGKAAMDGMMSAILAQRDFTGPWGVLDSHSEFARLFSTQYDPVHLTDALGSRYHILANCFKSYAACLLLHPVIDGLLSLKTEHDLTPGVIEKIELEVAPLCLSVTHKPKVASGTEGKFSIQFSSALAVARGKVGSREFVDEAVSDHSIQDVMQKVVVRSNVRLEETEANMVVHTSDGLRHERHVSVPKGDPKNPLTFDEILKKFKDLNSETFSEKRIEEIAETIWDLEKLRNTSRLIDLCYPDLIDGV